MYRIDNATAITPIPVPAAVGPKPNCFFTKGDAGLGVPATIVDDDWANAVQEEISAVIEAAGITLNKTVRTQLLTSVRSLTRTKLTAATSFYVTTAGNDATGTGAIGAPWLTLQKAINSLLLGYDFGGFAVTINVGAGTFAGANIFGLGAGQAGLGLVINGAGVGTTIINSTIQAAYGAYCIVRNISLGVSSGNCLGATEYGRISLDTVSLSAAGAGNGLVRAQLNAQIQISGNITIAGGAQYAFDCVTGSSMFSNAATVTLTGTPAFAGAFVNTSTCGNVAFGNLTFVGSATGSRYSVTLNGVNNSNNGASFFPGNSAGSTATGGQYT